MLPVEYPVTPAAKLGARRADRFAGRRRWKSRRMTSDPSEVSPAPRVLVLGATGYVGGRLIPELVRHGHPVRCLVRSSASAFPWSDDVEVTHGDLLEPDTLGPAFEGVDTVVYLVHSLGEDDFESIELEAARHVRSAAEQAGVRHMVYLSGLGDDDEELSPHLRSRHAVGEELAAGPIAVTELRAAVILGAGSASFEMLRSLTEVLPVMIAPKWVTVTKVQPIAIGDALAYLRAAVDAGPSDDHHRIVEIGGPDQLTYRDLIDLYAEVAGLPKRRLLPVPLVQPGLSTHWVNLVSPLPRQLAASLIDSLRNDVVVTDDSASRLSDVEPASARIAIEYALSAVQDLDIPTRWSGISAEQRAGRPRPWDPEWSGGTVYEYVTETDTDVTPEQFLRTVRGIGGDRGWYGFGWLWWLRGVADKVLGGVGLRRGRRHPDDITVGEALDFWRVDAIEPDLFRLRAEMRVPGEAWLEWRATVDVDGTTHVVQKARYVPRGLAGRLYWWPLWPFHAVIFPTMLRRIARDAERRAADATTSDLDHAA